ncbi:MAG: hypothetical protein AAFR76_10300 [Planctomycetota bacterium]
MKRTLDLDDRPPWFAKAMAVYHEEYEDNMRCAWRKLWGALCRSGDGLKTPKPGGLSESGLGIDSIDALADYLRLELVLRRQTKRMGWNP